MEILAYTSGGDGVRTTPIHCQTEQDGKSLKAWYTNASILIISFA